MVEKAIYLAKPQHHQSVIEISNNITKDVQTRLKDRSEVNKIRPSEQHQPVVGSDNPNFPLPNPARDLTIHNQLYITKIIQDPLLINPDIYLTNTNMITNLTTMCN